jgi:hypothetical protein
MIISLAENHWNLIGKLGALFQKIPIFAEYPYVIDGNESSNPK